MEYFQVIIYYNFSIVSTNIQDARQLYNMRTGVIWLKFVIWQPRNRNKTHSTTATYYKQY